MVKKEECENHPRAVSFPLRAVGSEMLPFSSSFSPNADLSGVMCVRTMLLREHWDSRESSDHWFFIISKQQL